MRTNGGGPQPAMLAANHLAIACPSLAQGPGSQVSRKRP